MNAAYAASMGATVDRLEAEKDSITGVIITSAKKTFFAGGDLNDLIRTTPGPDAAEFAAGIREVKAQLRRLETLGRPVVAAINGAALGGGLEITLARHHRIVVDDPKIQLGLPEVHARPAARRRRRRPHRAHAGHPERADGACCCRARAHRPAKALEIGLVDELVASPDELVPAAKAWIAANPRGRPAVGREGLQDARRHAVEPVAGAEPAGVPGQPAQADSRAPTTRPRANIMAAAVEGAQVDFDTAIEIEGRYFTDLVTGQVAKNMIQAFFFDLQTINGGPRPAGGHRAVHRRRRSSCSAPGMMGAGDRLRLRQGRHRGRAQGRRQEAAERARPTRRSSSTRRVARGRSTQEKGDALLARITATDQADGRRGRRPGDRGRLRGPGGQGPGLRRDRAVLADDALLCSNTSTLPITELAAGRRTSRGLHRPALLQPGRQDAAARDHQGRADQRRGRSTARSTSAKQIRKTPIVVNDSRGFFTSRVIGTFINEGIAMLAEGVPAPSIEQASSQAGYPAPVLQLSDELNMKLMAKIRKAAREAVEADGGTWVGHPSEQVIDRMLGEFDRPGRLEGAGFYDYDGRQAHRPVAGAAGRVPAGRGPVDDRPARTSRSGCSSSRRSRRCKCLDEGVLETVVGRQHRLDHGHRLPGLDRWGAAVHQRLRRRPRPASSHGRGTSPRSTATASSPRRPWSPRPRPARRTPTSRRWRARRPRGGT